MYSRLGLLIGLISLLLFTAAYGEQMAVSSKATAAADSELKLGQEIYVQVCAACHDSGLAGAPKLGDKVAWAPRIAQGIEKMLKSAIQGKGGMPPRGGQAGLSDEKIKAAVSYMVSKSK
jgi:cytochrome c5